MSECHSISKVGNFSVLILKTVSNEVVVILSASLFQTFDPVTGKHDLRPQTYKRMVNRSVW